MKPVSSLKPASSAGTLRLALAAALVAAGFVVWRTHPSRSSLTAFCVAAAFAVWSLYGQIQINLRLARLSLHNRSLMRVMASTSRQAFLFVCPLSTVDGSFLDFTVIFTNRAARHAAGLTRSQLKNAPLLPLVHGDVRASFMKLCVEVITRQSSMEAELKLGSYASRLEAFRVKLIPVSGGIAICAVCSEEEAAARKKVDELNQFTESVFESAPVSIIATDASGIILAMNTAAQQLTLYRTHELVGRHSLLLLHDTTEISRRSVELSQQTGQPVRAGFESLIAAPSGSIQDREWSYVRRDGSSLWVNLAMSPLFGPSGVITGYLAIAFDTTERKRLADAAQHMAHHDQLTGLLNRSLLESQLQEAIDLARQLDSGLGVYLVDIDHFKRINDSLGHSAGDALLVTVAARLLAVVRASDTVVRIGGDEFVLLMPRLQGSTNADRRAQVLLDEISRPCTIEGREVHITASIGYCLFPAGAENAADLMRKADLAMYASKSAGRGTFRAFGTDLERVTTDRLAMEEDLHRAIEREELALHYQPQIDCVTGKVTGIEMLLRWMNKERGNVPPDVFIPVAQEAGLMAGIGRWALRKACSDCVTAQETLGFRLRVAVNLSAQEFRDIRLPALVAEVLAESGLKAADLELEITEQVLMEATPCLLETLDALRALGVSLALDDFGTGFSNFSYILQYNVDRLKIDRSFIGRTSTDPAAAKVIRTVLAMAHGLGMSVCAEGVETQEQLDFLKRRKCNDVQGFLFSPAVPLSRLPATIAAIHARDGSQPALECPLTGRDSSSLHLLEANSGDRIH